MKKKLLCSLCLLFFCFIAYPQWEWQNPKPQGKSLKAVDFVDEYTGYIAGYDGTLLKTTDGGISWKFVWSGKKINFTSLYFQDANTGFAAGIYFNGIDYKGQVFKTINGGQTWDTLTVGNVGYINAMCFTGIGTGYIIGQAGFIQKTTDGGQSWNTQVSGVTAELISICFINANQGYILTNNGLLQTTNGGSTWNLSALPWSYHCTSIFFTSPSVGYITGYDNGSPDGKILKTINGGTTWTQMNVGMDWIYSVKFINSSIGFAGSYGAIYKTTNAGASWSPFYLGYANYIYSIDMVNSNTGYAVGNMGIIAKTINGGATWTIISSCATYEGLYSIQFINDSIGFSAGESGTFLRTADGGNHWTKISGLPSTWIQQVFFTTPNKGFFASQDGIYKTTNSGNTWNNVSLASANYRACYFCDSMVGYVAGTDGKIFKTINAGNTWIDCSYNVSNCDFTSLYFTDTNTGYATGSYWTGSDYQYIIIKTTDGGDNWSPLSYNYPYGLYSLFFPSASTGYACGAFGIIVKTTNAGITWDSLTWGANNFLESIFFKDTNTGYAVGSNTIIKTIDGGLSWHPYLNAPTGEFKSVHIQGDNTYIAGLGGYILKKISLQANFNLPLSCVTEPTQFNDQSTGEPIAWNWTFPGGTPSASNVQNPVVTYSTPGNYSVSLTVYNGIDSSSYADTNGINIYAFPGVPGTPTGDTMVCTNNTLQSIFSTIGSTNTNSYMWEINPPAAGSISGNLNTATVTWTSYWVGIAKISVKGVNVSCGEGAVSDSFNVDCKICSNISENQSEQSISVFPNPATDQLTICLNPEPGSRRISIMNILNNEVMAFETSSLNSNTVNIDLRNFSNGIYFLHIKNDVRESVYKFIVQ